MKSMDAWASFQYPTRHLIVRSHLVSKPGDWCWELSDCSEIWQAPRQHCCRGACHISEQCDNSNYQSRGFETSRDFTIRRLIGYWNGALIFKWVVETSQQGRLQVPGVGQSTTCPSNSSQGPLLLTWLTLFPTWISNYFHYKVCKEITYPFPNFNGNRWSLGMGK